MLWYQPGLFAAPPQGGDDQPRVLGSRKLQQTSTVYIRLLTQTLGAHLDDAALNELAASTGKLLKALT